MAQEHILRECIVEQSPSAANHGLAFSGYVIRERDAGREVVEVLVIQLIGLIVAPTIRGIERVHEPVLFSRHSEVIPAHTVVKSQPRGGAEAVLNKEPVTVLVSMAMGISGNLAAVVGQAVQEIGQVGKVKCAPEVVIDDVVDGGAAKFVAELHVMLSGFPGIVVDKMPVRIDAIAGNGIGRANLRETGNGGCRKAAVVSAGARLQSDRIGNEALVLREKAFRKTVPSQASLIDLSGVDHLHVGKSDQLDPSRRDGIESGKKTASQLREGETLIAVAEVVATGQHVIGIEVLVDLADEAVYAIEEGG